MEESLSKPHNESSSTISFLESEDQNIKVLFNDFCNFLGELKCESIGYNKIQLKETEIQWKNRTSIFKEKLSEKIEEEEEKEKIEKSDRDLGKLLLYFKGRHLYKLGKYIGAKKAFKKSAKWGRKEAMHCLGIMYSNGKGCIKSLKKASYWVTMAYQNGSENAASTLKRIVHEAFEEKRYF